MDLERLRRLTEADPERIARQVRDQVREYIELNRRRFQPPPPDPRPALIAFLGGLIMGALAMWLLDPEQGVHRRVRLMRMFQRVGEPLGAAAERARGSTSEQDTAYAEAGTAVFGTADSVYGDATVTGGLAGRAAGGLGVTEEQAPQAASETGSYATAETEPASTGTSAGSTRSEERSEGS